MNDGDVRERLLARPRITPQHISDRESYSHDDLLHSIGSFSAVVWPVAVTMLIASFVSVNVVDPVSAKALAKAYLIYGPEKDKEASTGTKLEDALINALAIVSFFIVATFVIVCCYKFNFNRMLIGYMMFSSAMLLGMLGGNMLIIIVTDLNIPIDVLTLFFAMYNFSVVGVLSIFYQKGLPTWLTQTYLVLTSVIMAWQLGQFPEWSSWALLVVLAFYDLCAVLTPCGPLKWLVSLVQQEGRPLPAEIIRNPSDQFAQPVHESVYYQCESEIPLRICSPLNLSRASETSAQSLPTSLQTQLRVRLIKFYMSHNPSAVSRVDKIIERYQGRESQLWHDLEAKYNEELKDTDETIKLGLGDFVFYSVLVSRAAKYDFSAMIGCLVSILMGLGGTLLLLGIHQKALPALPISILLAVIMYFWLRVVFMDYATFAFSFGVPL
ncbi:presenilin-like protein [Plasmopara halstedii]|uniref:Presenilin n=1 Tax=Plasmopara halstedii TaxID=4781 RepID=A0A0P1ABT8_PLAHL|nr:presenilin-like protein [Plasmopara halstedii]CEG38126.1 presenilin-like protein [Plasmopara halstedii]|eukprot:XP_024574495.1 presenilin-like protein [Plasmopara halstedii]